MQSEILSSALSNETMSKLCKSNFFYYTVFLVLYIISQRCASFSFILYLCLQHCITRVVDLLLTFQLLPSAGIQPLFTGDLLENPYIEVE